MHNKIPPPIIALICGIGIYLSRSFFPEYNYISTDVFAVSFLLIGIILFFGLLLIYPFNVIAISSIVYVLMFPISFLHYQKLKKQNVDSNSVDDDDLEDVL